MKRFRFTGWSKVLVLDFKMSNLGNSVLFRLVPENDFADNFSFNFIKENSVIVSTIKLERCSLIKKKKRLLRAKLIFLFQ